MVENDLDALLALKRRVLDLASDHWRALDIFYLSRDLHSLKRLKEGPAAVGGFANVVPDPGLERDGTARASLASTAPASGRCWSLVTSSPAMPTSPSW